ncbi:AbiJ-related protein [Streptomyces goshikiensis]|uniref:AbiJ-related protein n=1 Tax=Streptomyces goshikiensis TaxID=1942 RepID=UPI0036A1544B
MAAIRDRSTLRRLVGDVAARLGSNTHATLNEAFAKVGMPPNSDEGTKSERVERSFAQVPDSDLHTVAQHLLANGYANTAQRHEIEDVLWAEACPPGIPSRTRRELARSLDLADLVRSESRFMAMLSRFWVLADEMSPLMDAFFGTPGPSLKRDIEQHVFRNPGDWSTEDLFENLGAFCDAPVWCQWGFGSDGPSVRSVRAGCVTMGYTCF